jgi:two-component system cell cycle response regulator
MLERFRNAFQGSATPAPFRRTTEVHHLDGQRAATGALADEHQPALIVMRGDLPGQVFHLRSGRQLLGRRSECDIRIRDRAVSGIHAEIVVTGTIVTIHDLASTNGTIVNGTRIQAPLTLGPGALVRLGNSIFRFVDSAIEIEFTEALHARGITDQLTGAFNQAYLASRLALALETASADRPLSLIAFDFDDFKSVNDRYGHAAGDHVLRITTALIRDTCIRSTDVFARMGGEEFAVMLPATPLTAAIEIAEAIRNALAAGAFEYHATAIAVRASLGVVTATHPAESAEALLERADALLYRSKNEGRNRVTAE